MLWIGLHQRDLVVTLKELFSWDFCCLSCRKNASCCLWDSWGILYMNTWQSQKFECEVFNTAYREDICKHRDSMRSISNSVSWCMMWLIDCLLLCRLCCIKKTGRQSTIPRQDDFSQESCSDMQSAGVWCSSCQQWIHFAVLWEACWHWCYRHPENWWPHHCYICQLWRWCKNDYKDYFFIWMLSWN